MKYVRRSILAVICVLLALSGCVVPAPNSRPWMLDETPNAEYLDLPSALQTLLPTPRPVGAPYYTPTPDAPHALPDLRTDGFYYTVESGDSLSLLAQVYDLPLATLIEYNPAVNPEALLVGQVLFIPAPEAEANISNFKIIPDSELVYGPASATLDIEAFVSQHAGYLSTYKEDLDGQTLSGAQIVQRICYEYSVNPRLLIALLEYQSGWVSNPQPDPTFSEYPMGRAETNRKGLYKQLAWTADTLNHAYYLYEINALPYVILADNSMILLSTIINPGTAAVQYLVAQLYERNGYLMTVSEHGVYATYVSMFGIPFDMAVEPLLPTDLTQPSLLLPFESGVVWSFTGGPHGGWGSGSGWAALDFAPPGEEFGCVSSDAWVTATSDGLVIRAKDGAVVLDLDGDGLEQTGWTLLYMHVESRDRVSAGTTVKAGDRLGHPSCEGGVSNGTHVHIARRYNGEWIAADRDLPFNLEGWVSSGDGAEYEGTLTRDGLTLTAWDGRVDENQIQR